LAQNGADSTKERNAYHSEWDAFHRITFYFFPFSVATPSNLIPKCPEIFSFHKKGKLLHSGIGFAFPYLKGQSKPDKSPLSYRS
jgi:hypothetical protein